MASSRMIWGGLGALSLGALGVNSMYTGSLYNLFPKYNND